MNSVSSLRRQMIKTYLPASNAALLPQKMLQSWMCRSERALQSACEIKFCFFCFHLYPLLFFFFLVLKHHGTSVPFWKQKNTPMLCNAMQPVDLLRRFLDMTSQVGKTSLLHTPESSRLRLRLENTEPGQTEPNNLLPVVARCLFWGADKITQHLIK